MIRKICVKCNRLVEADRSDVVCASCRRKRGENPNIDYRNPKNRLAVLRQHQQARDHLYKSMRWVKLREAMLKTYPVCQDCGERLATEVHHTSYTNFYEQKNLQCLCRDCHAAITRGEKKPVNTG